MPEKTKNNSIFQFAKTLLLSSLTSMLVLLLISLISAFVLKKVNGYESLYNVITIVAYGFMGFLSAKLTNRRYMHSLLPVLLLQTVFNTLLLCVISAVATKELPQMSQVLFSFVTMFAAAILSLFFKKKKQTKNR